MYNICNPTFKNISAISCQSINIGGGNRSTQKKPLTCCKSLTTLSHNVVSSTPRHEV